MPKLQTNLILTLKNEMTKLEGREAALKAELADVHTSLKYLRKIVRGAHQEDEQERKADANPVKKSDTES